MSDTPETHEHTCSPDGNMVDCDACGARDCPWGEAMHYHHDGCPSCDVGPFGSEDVNEARVAWGHEIKRLRERLQEIYEAAGANEHAQILDMLRNVRSGEGLRIIAEQRAEIERLKEEYTELLGEMEVDALTVGGIRQQLADARDEIAKLRLALGHYAPVAVLSPLATWTESHTPSDAAFGRGGRPLSAITKTPPPETDPAPQADLRGQRAITSGGEGEGAGQTIEEWLDAHARREP
jgi:hypothetical protein